MSARRRGRVVAVGGGHGLSRTLAALVRVAAEVTAVVTTADDGGSSGRLRRDLGVVPPGDLRMALASLSPDDRLTELLQYRFESGELDGHSLGNLLLVALQDLLGDDLVAALDELGRLVRAPGRVLPCTLTPVILHADTAAGTVSGQAAVASTPRIDRVWLEPADPEATGAAVDAISRADLVVLGPGSLYTSILPNLLVPGIEKAVAASTAAVVLIGNLREQLGETEGMSLADHVEAIHDHAPSIHLDTVVAHDGETPSGRGRRLMVPGEDVVGCRVLAADLLDGLDGHAPSALVAVLTRLLDDRLAGARG